MLGDTEGGMTVGGVTYSQTYENNMLIYGNDDNSGDEEYSLFRFMFRDINLIEYDYLYGTIRAWNEDGVMGFRGLELKVEADIDNLKDGCREVRPRDGAATHLTDAIHFSISIKHHAPQTICRHLTPNAGRDGSGLCERGPQQPLCLLDRHQADRAHVLRVDQGRGGIQRPSPERAGHWRSRMAPDQHPRH